MDRAEELREREDLWVEVRDELPMAVVDAARACSVFLARAADEIALRGKGELVDALEAKFAAGEREHQRGWLSMAREQLDTEINNELLDLVLYAAMIRTRWEGE